MVTPQELIARILHLEKMTWGEQEKAIKTLIMEVKKDAPPAVELIPAYSWTCHDCGIDNWVRCVTHPLSLGHDREDIEEMYSEEEIEDIKEGRMAPSITSHPYTVKCECGAEYRAMSMESPTEEESEEL